MLIPVVLFVLSLLGAAASALPGFSDFALVAGASAVASLILIIRAAVRPAPRRRNRPNEYRPHRSVFQSPTVALKYIVVDGSNVMHWKDGVPDITVLRDVVAHLTRLGYAPGVVFDANAGYKISGSYQHDGALGRLLGLPQDRVMVVPKGTQADPLLLTAARDLGARVVSNDRFRDWADRHPEVTQPGHLVRGGFRDGKLWLDLDP